MTLFISLKSSLLNNVIIHSKLKKILHLESHKNIIFSILSTIYQHFLSVETKIFSYIKYFENAKNFVVIYKLYTLFRLDSFKNISTKSFIFIPSTLH